VNYTRLFEIEGPKLLVSCHGSLQADIKAGRLRGYLKMVGM
jgi:hypothetical protein